MFYPFRTLIDLKTDGSYWKKFKDQLRMYSGKQNTTEEKLSFKFWPKGFEILQNFQDRFTLEKRLNEQEISFSCRQHFNNQILGTQKIKI